MGYIIYRLKNIDVVCTLHVSYQILLVRLSQVATACARTNIIFVIAVEYQMTR